MYYYLHKDGEPLLHPRIAEMLYYIKKARPHNRIFLSTNAVFLNMDISKAIIDSGVDILRVSASGANPETYLKVHGVDDYEVVKENVISFLELKKKMGATKPLVRMQIIACSHTLNEIESYRRMWKVYDVEVTTKSFMTWGGKKRDPIVDWKRDGRHPCIDLWTMPAINWDGTVSICSLDWNQSAIIGDLNKQTLKEIWNGELIRRYRKLHLQNRYGKAGICGPCVEWQSNRKIFWRNYFFFWKEDRWI